jgi:hypothetical protein
MFRRSAAAATLLIALATHALAGGHAVIRVVEMPKALAAGRPLALAFTVHDALGAPIDRLRPVVVAECGKARFRVGARPAGTSGTYTAALRFPRAGAWKLTVDSGYCGNTHVMHGIQVAAAPVAAR